ncbi:MAG: hypothetical protein MUE60_11085 [Candidatus Eisenbacteria bacterium]|jgi:hypothetical protein|nr:hypothetical protein [Candidatus Eisenbacteria bacterium]
MSSTAVHTLAALIFGVAGVVVFATSIYPRSFLRTVHARHRLLPGLAVLLIFMSQAERSVSVYRTVPMWAIVVEFVGLALGGLAAIVLILAKGPAPEAPPKQ